MCLSWQAYDLSMDHKPELQEEKERILKAGGCIQHGRVNGVLNLARAIGTYTSFQFIPQINIRKREAFHFSFLLLCNLMFADCRRQ